MTRPVPPTVRAEPATVVVFRRWRDTGDVIALFPEIDEGSGMCASYMHVGQHSAADYGGVIGATHPASVGDADVVSLMRELESDPYRYNLKPKLRAPSWRSASR